MHRTHTCGELDTSFIGKEVMLSGWVKKLRNMGWLVFIDLRDRYGVTQIAFNPDDISDSSLLETAQTLKNEYVVKIVGIVQARPEGMVNDDMVTGGIEIVPSSLVILNKSKEIPFNLGDDPKTSEETRFRYRYLDLRRQKTLNNVIFKSKMCAETRRWFTGENFLEVQTPIFTVSSPEWARDFVIPSRLQPGKFYALPQAPQQYKQLLMVGGIDKYFQIAPCFRDEDPRADRHQCEFYQVDLEMSFVEQEDVLRVLEAYSRFITETMVPHKKITTDFPRISYKDAMDDYGSDRPDLRFGMKLVDLSAIVKDSGFGVFANTVKDGWVVKAIRLEGESMTRKEIDVLTDFVKRLGAGGLAYLILEEGKVRSPIAKFFSDEEMAKLVETTGAKDGDMVFFGAGSYDSVSKVLWKLRLELRDKYHLADNNELAYCFVVDFPFYEWDENRDRLEFGHNPFSWVDGWLEALASEDPLSVMTFQYDVVLNGFELGSGSIRNHDPEVLVKVFEKVGLSEEDVKAKFGAMYEAFQYGCPPHGGFAFGLDRHMMVLLDEPSVRECYAFPKSWRGEDLMMRAPAMIDPEVLDELSLDVKIEEEKE